VNVHLAQSLFLAPPPTATAAAAAAAVPEGRECASHFALETIDSRGSVHQRRQQPGLDRSLGLGDNVFRALFTGCARARTHDNTHTSPWCTLTLDRFCFCAYLPTDPLQKGNEYWLWLPRRLGEDNGYYCDAQCVYWYENLCHFCSTLDGEKEGFTCLIVQFLRKFCLGKGTLYT
jgi:hypothetical protein